MVVTSFNGGQLFNWWLPVLMVVNCFNGG